MSEPTNAQRVQRARAALDAYANFYGEEPDNDDIADLLADLHHFIAVDWGSRHAIDEMEDHLRRAVCNFEAEVDDPTPTSTPDTVPEEVRHMDPTVLRTLRGAVDTLIDANKTAEQRALDEQRYAVEDAAFRERALTAAGKVIADINHIAAILWNTRFPNAAIPKGRQVYSIHPDINGSTSMSRNSFENDKHGPGVFARALHIGVAYGVCCPYKSPDDTIFRAFQTVFRSMGHDDRQAPALSIYEGPTDKHPWRFYHTAHVRNSAGVGGGVVSYTEFIEKVSAALAALAKVAV
jgi:hypothetical protein